MKCKENPGCMCITITAAGPNLLVQAPYPLNCSSPHGQHKSQVRLSRRTRKCREYAAGTGTGRPAAGAGYGQQARAQGEDGEHRLQLVLCRRQAQAWPRAHEWWLQAAGVFVRVQVPLSGRGCRWHKQLVGSGCRRCKWSAGGGRNHWAAGGEHKHKHRHWLRVQDTAMVEARRGPGTSTGMGLSDRRSPAGNGHGRGRC
jgi:hypothetical protein